MNFTSRFLLFQCGARTFEGHAAPSSTGQNWSGVMDTGSGGHISLAPGLLALWGEKQQGEGRAGTPQGGAAQKEPVPTPLKGLP